MLLTLLPLALASFCTANSDLENQVAEQTQPRHPKTVALLNSHPSEFNSKIHTYKGTLFWCRNNLSMKYCQDLFWDMQYILHGSFKRFNGCRTFVRHHHIGCSYFSRH